MLMGKTILLLLLLVVVITVLFFRLRDMFENTS